MALQSNSRKIMILGILIATLVLQPYTQTPALRDTNFTQAQDELTFPIEVNPESYGVSDSEWSVHYRDMVAAPDDSAYTIGFTYEPRSDEIRYTLVKWTNNATVEWSRRITDGMYSEGLGVVYRKGFIYTVSELITADDTRLLVLMKWSSLGQLIWTQQYDWDIWLGSIRNADIAITPDDSIYVTGVSLQSIHLGLVMFLAKFNPNGQLLWNKTIGRDYLSAKICSLSSNKIVVGSNPHLFLFSSMGDPIWNRTCQFYSFDVSPLDSIYTFSHPSSGAGLNISKWNDAGDLEWSYSRSITWAQWTSTLNYRISTAADDSAYVIFGINLEDKGPIMAMMKISSSGEQLWNRSLIHQYGFPSGIMVDLDVAYSGRIFCGGLGVSDDDMVFAIAIYDIGTFTPLVSTTINPISPASDFILVIALMGVGALGIVAALAYIFRLKKN